MSFARRFHEYFLYANGGLRLFKNNYYVRIFSHLMVIEVILADLNVIKIIHSKKISCTLLLNADNSIIQRLGCTRKNYQHFFSRLNKFTE